MTEGRVVVVGSLNMDVIATTPRHPAVGETVLGSDLRFAPGGKGANQAVAAARLGAATEMIGRVGQDDFGDALLRFLSREGVAVDRVARTPDAATGTALIVVGEGGDNTIVVVPGANATVTIAEVKAVEYRPGDVVVAQFELPMPVVEAALAQARAAGARTILNPAPALATPDELLAVADVLVVNESELTFLAGFGEGTVDLSRRLRRRPDQTVIATLGPAGAVAVTGDDVIPVAGRVVPAVDTTGAGDCFVGALAAALIEDRSIAGALQFANRAAAISVQRMGAAPSMPRRAEVEPEWVRAPTTDHRY